MYKKRMIITVMMAVCFIAACAHKPDSEEQVDIRDAVGRQRGIRKAGWRKTERGSCQ